MGGDRYYLSQDTQDLWIPVLSGILWSHMSLLVEVEISGLL